MTVYALFKKCVSVFLTKREHIVAVVMLIRPDGANLTWMALVVADIITSPLSSANHNGTR